MNWSFTPDDLARAIKAGDVTPGKFGVAFTWWLAGSNGAGFALYREPKHTDNDIAVAKRWLRSKRDVVSLEVRRPA